MAHTTRIEIQGCKIEVKTDQVERSMDEEDSCIRKKNKAKQMQSFEQKTKADE